MPGMICAYLALGSINAFQMLMVFYYLYMHVIATRNSVYNTHVFKELEVIS